MDITVERATIGDAEEILALQKIAYISEAELYDDYTIDPLIETLEQIRTEFDKQAFFKVCADEKIVGSVRGYVEQETCYVARLIVSPDMQNRGIGASLMQHLENNFSDAKRFELFTGYRSERNIHLYNKLGYSTFKTEKVHERLTFLFMEKIVEG